MNKQASITTILLVIFILAVVVGGIFLFWAYNKPPLKATGQAIQTFQQTSNVQTNNPVKVSLTDIETILKKYYPAFAGTFVSLGNENPCAFNGYFTGDRGACQIWKYPAEGYTSYIDSDKEGNIFDVLLFDFDSNMPNIENGMFIYFQGDWSPETIKTSNGIIQQYTRNTDTSYSRDFHFVCGANYWIAIHYFSTTSSEFTEDTKSLAMIKEIIDLC